MKAKREKKKTPVAKAQKSAKRAKKRERGLSAGKVMLCLGVVSVVLAVLCFDVVSARSGSMSPSIDKGDIFVVYNPPWTLHSYAPGDIVALEQNSETPNVLRLIANNREEIAVTGELVRIGGRALRSRSAVSEAIYSERMREHDCFETLPNSRSHRIRCSSRALVSSEVRRVELGRGESYLLGDNRGAALDSRQLGAIDSGRLRGRVLFTLRTATQGGALFGRWLKFLD